MTSVLSLSSLMITFILSSNCPRYLVPATNAAKSKENIFLPNNGIGALPSLINCAKPSTIAVLPTPGSPTKIGLFFFLLESILETLSISFLRPITGSILPSSTALEMFLQKLFSAWYLSFSFGLFFFGTLSSLSSFPSYS